MSAAVSRRGSSRVRRIWQLLVVGLALTLLSGCAGFSARVTIVPAHQAFDLDLIWAGRINQNGDEIKSDCAALKKAGADAQQTQDETNVYCELKMPVPLDDHQPFVRHTDNRWKFQVTDKTLYDWLVAQIPSLKEQYPSGLKLADFDDFYLRVDFPGTVVAHNADGQVDGQSVIWKDAKPMFTADGLQAESADGHSWVYVAGVVSGIGIVLSLAGLLVGLLGSRVLRRRTTSWPPDHVTRWWAANRRQWLAERGRTSQEPDERR